MSHANPKAPPRILVVDDTRANIDVLVSGLRDEYQISIALNGESALTVAAKAHPDIILLDVMMPGMDGFEVCKRLKADPVLKDVPVLFLTALDEIANKTRGFSVGGADYIVKPFELQEVRARVRSHLHAKLYRDRIEDHSKFLEGIVSERTRALDDAKLQISRSFLETIFRLAIAAEFKDRDTGAHIIRIGFYAEAVARAMNLADDFCEGLLYAAPLHDIGKIGVPDAILAKPGPLDGPELATMRRHTEFGAKILDHSRSRVINLGKIIALTHHERWDGGGYPAGLREDSIPLSGQIVAVCDVFDALVSRRCYKEPMNTKEAFEIIATGKGTHFAPRVAAAFLGIREQIIEIKDRFQQSDSEFLLKHFQTVLDAPLSEAMLRNEN